MKYTVAYRDNPTEIDVHAEGCQAIRSHLDTETIEADSLADLAREIYYGFEDFENVTDEGALIQAQYQGMVFKPCALKEA